MSRLYRATAKYFAKRKGVPDKRFRPKPGQSPVEQLKVWKKRREEQIQGTRERKELALRNPRREGLKHERENLRSALGPYWRKRDGGKGKPFF